MSRKIMKEITCPHCSASVSTELWSSINVAQDAGARAKVLDESLFSWTCPSCGYHAKLLYPCLYHDMEGKFMVYLIPELSDKTFSNPVVEKQFPELGNIQKRLATDLNTLKEKILIFESGLSDKAIELTKLALSEVIAKRKGQAVSCGYFCSFDREQNQIGFSFFISGESEPCFQQTRLLVYEKSQEIAMQISQSEETGFLRIDAAWAADALARYQNNA